MDKVIEEERDIMSEIAESADDCPVLMLNQNRYKQGEYPNGDLYKKWRLVNKTMIDSVDGKIIWTLPVKGQVLINGHLETLDEILAYWYPSHGAFLDMIKSPKRIENFEIRKELIEYAVIHRCDGNNPPKLNT